MKYAIIKGGAVENVIVALPYNLSEFPDAVEIDDARAVEIGDSYAGGKFYRDNVEVLTDYEREEQRLRPFIEKAAQSLDDKDASTAPTLFPALNQDGQLVKAGARINWRGIIKRAAVDLWDREDNDPDHAPSLWEDLNYKNGIRIIPDVITVGTAFANGEKGWWKDKLFESKIDNNVFTPAQYPDGWKEVADEVEAK